MTPPPFKSLPNATKCAEDFYTGMVQATSEFRASALPHVHESFAKRELQVSADLAFKHHYKISRFTTNLNEVDKAVIPVLRIRLELFAMLSALNLYLAKQMMEDFAMKAIMNSFFKETAKHEDNWLELNNAQIIDFQEQTGYPRNEWRSALTERYLEKLETRNSRDSAELVAMRSFLARQGLAGEAGVHISPALLEECTKEVEHPGSWLVNYLQAQSG